MKTIRTESWNARQSWHRRDLVIVNTATYRITLQRNSFDEQCLQIIERYDGMRWHVIDDVCILLMPKKYQELNYANSRVDVSTAGLAAGMNFMMKRLAEMVSGASADGTPAGVLLSWASGRAEFHSTPRRDELIARHLDGVIAEAFELSEDELEEICGEDE